MLQPVKAEIQFRVQPAYYELAGKITAALTNAINVGHSEWGDVGEGGREEVLHGDNTQWNRAAAK